MFIKISNELMYPIFYIHSSHRTFSYFTYYCLLLILVDSYSLSDCDFQYGYLALASGVEFFGILGGIQMMYYYSERVVIQFVLFIFSGIVLLIYASVYTMGSNSIMTEASLSMLFLGKVTIPAALAIMWVHTVELFPTEV